jgi:hypothetical protein
MGLSYPITAALGSSPRPRNNRQEADQQFTSWSTTDLDWGLAGHAIIKLMLAHNNDDSDLFNASIAVEQEIVTESKRNAAPESFLPKVSGIMMS